MLNVLIDQNVIRNNSNTVRFGQCVLCVNVIYGILWDAQKSATDTMVGNIYWDLVHVLFTAYKACFEKKVWKRLEWL